MVAIGLTLAAKTPGRRRAGNRNRFGAIWGPGIFPQDRRGRIVPGMAERDAEQGLRMTCGKCGSDEVTRDAWAEWNVAAQGWGLGAMFEHAFCHRCQAATRIVEAPLAGAGTGEGAGVGRTDP